MREQAKFISEDDILENLERILEELQSNSKNFEFLSAIRSNIQMRKENQRIRSELENLKSQNRKIQAQNNSIKRRLKIQKQRKLRIKRKARMLVQERKCLFQAYQTQKMTIKLEIDH